MPECAEVKISADWLSARLVGKQLHSMVFHPHSRYYDHMSANGESADDHFNRLQSTIRNYRVVEINAKGKLLWIHLHANQIPPMRAHVDRYIHVSSGMSGGWRYPSSPGWQFKLAGEMPHDAWSMCTSGGQETIYHDARKFGTLKVLTPEQHLVALEKLGPDVLTDSQESIFGGIGGGNLNHTILSVLLNQNRVSGIGNYLVSEILYRADIAPSRKMSDLYISEIQRIAFMSQVAARDSYNYGGCTLHSWRNPEGGKGTYQTRLSVYGRELCPLRHKVTKEKDSTGRTSYWCAECQQ